MWLGAPASSVAELTVVPKRVGGSICVFIPADVAREEGIQEGKPIRVTVRAVRRRAEVVGKHRGIGGFQRSKEGLWGDW